MASKLDFTNKVIIVTGSSFGIGKETAVLFAKLGGSLVITGRNEAKIAEVVEKCNSVSPCGAKALGVTGEMTNENDVKRLICETITRFKKLDVLVNNAGIMPFAGIDSPNLLEVFDTTSNTCLRALLVICQLAAPHLIQSKGCIVNLSTVAAKFAYHGLLPYGAVKAGCDMVTKNLAVDLGPKEVRVNSVSPGAIRTNLVARLGVPLETREDMYTTYGKKVPLRTEGLPKFVADAIVFLASDMASFMTGADLPVDGGHHLVSLYHLDNTD